MRFIHDDYQNLAQGYQVAKDLDSKLTKHPAIILRDKQKVARRKKTLQYAALAVGVGWQMIPCLFVAGLLTSDHGMETFMPMICCTASFMMLATTVLALIWRRKTEKEQAPVYRRWIDTVSSRRVPDEDTLCDKFLGNLSKNSEAFEEATEHGAIGVLRTLNALSGRLGDGWFVLTNVMISRKEDADIVVVGPSGIWILESKYWDGYINIEQGRWSRVRVYYTPGRHRQTEYTRINKCWDAQWMRQSNALVGILSRATFSVDGRRLPDLITGGIVLSHRQARLNTDGSQHVDIANISYWCYRMSLSENNPCLSFEERLRVVDALLSVSQQNQKVSRTYQPAEPVAVAIGKDILEKAREATRSNRHKAK